jgi:serine/threonine-protein kinase HipA
VADALEVWLYGVHVATVEQNRRRLALTYTTEARDAYEPGTPLLSLSLPVSAETFGSVVVRPFLAGLLPEEDPLGAIAAELGLRADDVFGLLAALGRECAGAIVLQPEGNPPPSQATTTTAEPIDEDQLAELISNLRASPLGASHRVRVSLGGAQEKLLLTRMPDGRWGRPVEGTPSTHILKPEIRRVARSVANEAFCMRLAKHLKVPVAEVEVVDVNERPVLVVARYDRIVDADGKVQRVHQEDFCQALGLPPRRKYEQEGGPGLRKLAETLGGVDPNSLPTFLAYLIVHVLVANGDAHAKNYSLLHTPEGVLTLAPLYDVMSTLRYGVEYLAMFVDSVQRLDRVTGARVVNEAARWGLSRDTSANVLYDLVTRAPAAVEQAASETSDLASEVLDTVASQLKALGQIA